MKIVALELYPKSLTLKSPSTVAYSSITEAEHLFARIITEDGLEGWGCCAPDRVVTGETVSEIHAFLDERGRDILVSPDAGQIASLMARLKKEGPNFPGARMAVNLALSSIPSVRTLPIKTHHVRTVFSRG